MNLYCVEIGGASWMALGRNYAEAIQAWSEAWTGSSSDNELKVTLVHKDVIVPWRILSSCQPNMKPVLTSEKNEVLAFDLFASKALALLQGSR